MKRFEKIDLLQWIQDNQPLTTWAMSAHLLCSATFMAHRDQLQAFVEADWVDIDHQADRVALTEKGQRGLAQMVEEERRAQILGRF